jgi:hypothetical protein
MPANAFRRAKPWCERFRQFHEYCLPWLECSAVTRSSRLFSGFDGFICGAFGLASLIIQPVNNLPSFLSFL